MPAALPYMPVYIGDYLGDTGHLSTLEHGAYLLLLFHYWRRGEPLPNDPERLRRIAGVSKPVWSKISQNLESFFVADETHWTHKRVEEELERARVKSLKAQAAGRQSAVARRERPLNGRLADAQRSLSMSESESESEKNSSSSSVPDLARGRMREATTTTIGEEILGEFRRQTGRAVSLADELEAAKLGDVDFDSVRRGIAASIRKCPEGQVSSLRYCVPAIRLAERARSQANVGAAPRAVPDPETGFAVDELARGVEYSADEKTPVFAAAAAFIRRSAALSGEPPSRDELRRHLFERGCDLGVVDAIYPASIPSASSGPAISAVTAAKE
ncbi:MAG: DUF1376 domain-containing protein [Deltaproteobacteria bacterium]|nr:DUF1376 domain-containing protein [Deltaproteobacteria bacterium]